MSSLRVCLPVIASLLFSAPCIAQTTGAPSTVVVKQGDVSVTLADVDAFAKSVPAKDRRGFFDNPNRIESLLTNLLLQKQLAAEARAAGIDKSPATQSQIELAIDTELAKIRMQQFRTDVKVPNLDELAREEYIAHKEKYLLPVTVTVKHVLISTKERSDEEAKALADKVAVEAKADPAGFDALVEKYSDDPSKADNHGVIVDAASGKYAPEFAQASGELMKPNEISPVVKTGFGYHVIELVKREEAKKRSFEEVKGEIAARLRSEFVDKQVKGHTDALRNQPMDANEALVASLRQRYADEATSPAGK